MIFCFLSKHFQFIKMPVREAIVITNLGVSTYATNKQLEEILADLKEKHKYEQIFSIKVSERIAKAMSH